ncbi:MAG: PAS domain S-box protein [Bacteroidota bacterium]
MAKGNKSKAEMLKLIHELQVRQAELETLNKELNLEKEKALINITGLEKAEEALAQEQYLMLTLLDNLPDHIYFKDRESRFIKINKAMAQFHGLNDPEQAIGKTDADFFTNEHAQQALRDELTIIRTDRLLSIEEKETHHDRPDTWVSTIKLPMRDKNGNIIGTFGISRNITERKQADMILQKSEERFKNISTSISDLLYSCVTDANGVYYFDWIYGACEEITGFTNEELIAMNCWGKLVIDEDFPVFKKHILDVKPGLSDICQLRIKNKKGHIIWIQASSKCVKQKGSESCFLFGGIIDITEKKHIEKALFESEEKYRLLIDNANESIVVAQDGLLKFINPMTLVLMEGYSEQELIGRPFPEFIHPDDQNMVVESYRRWIANDEVQKQYTFRVVTREGVIKWVEINATMIEWHGKPATLNFLTDITGRKQAEEEIKLKNIELQKRNAEKDKFFSIIAHDLRNPFMGFLGLTQLLDEELPGLTPSETQNIATNLRNSATNQYRLLENLLQWSRMEQGLVPFNPAVVKLRPIVDESITTALESAKIKGIEITVNIPDHMQIFADSNILQTIIRNLISNAVKFTPKGGNVNLSAISTGEKNVEISVEDSGIGMSRAMVDGLFRLDVKSSRSGTEGESSTGLGLIICKDLVEKHGGELLVESEEGKGSNFRFTLPSLI